MSHFNGFFTVVSKFRTGFWALLLASCTIIEDSDITSQSELKKVKLTSIDIVQDTHGGSKTVTAKLVEDATVNVSTPDGILTRYVEWSVPALPSLKLKYRSPIATAHKYYQYYLSNGNLYTFGVQKDTIFAEVYRFRYDATGRLNKIITFINPSLSSSTTIDLASKDTLIYKSSGELEKITRKLPDGSMSDFSAFTFNNRLTGFTFGGTNYSNPNSQGSGSCPNGGSGLDLCGSLSVPFNTGNTNISGPYVNYFDQKQLGLLNSFRLEDGRYSQSNNNQPSFFQCSGTGCGRELDTYYFSPLFLIRDQLKIGDDLLILYAADWWKVGTAAVDNQKITKVEVVNFKFNYEVQ